MSKKVVLFNGSPRAKGCTFTALSEVGKSLESLGVEVEMVQLGTKAVHGCIACRKCKENDEQMCIFKDDAYLNLRQKAFEADAIIVGSPVYYAAPNGAMCAVLDRLFYSCGGALSNKVASAVVSCRRSGVTAALDRLYKYFSIYNMVIASSQYWHGVHGNSPEEVLEDAEGLQTMRKLAENVAWLINSTNPSESKLLDSEERIMTNFIR